MYKITDFFEYRLRGETSHISAYIGGIRFHAYKNGSLAIFPGLSEKTPTPKQKTMMREFARKFYFN